jgi:hypothetical protein
MLSFGKSTTPAHRRYVIRIMAFTIPYVAICVSMMTTDAFDEVMGKPAAWGLAAVVSAPVIGQIWAVLSLMRESVATFWGFGESFAGAPHIETWLIVPLFWGMYGLTAPFIRSSR